MKWNKTKTPFGATEYVSECGKYTLSRCNTGTNQWLWNLSVLAIVRVPSRYVPPDEYYEEDLGEMVPCGDYTTNERLDSRSVTIHRCDPSPAPPTRKAAEWLAKNTLPKTTAQCWLTSEGKVSLDLVGGIYAGTVVWPEQAA